MPRRRQNFSSHINLARGGVGDRFIEMEVKMSIIKKVFTGEDLVTEELLHHLPEPVQRYMAYTGVVGVPWIRTVRLTQRGKFRQGLDRPWMSMTADQWYTTYPPSLVWKARFKIAGIPLLSARDQYQSGQGHMFGKLAGLFTVFDIHDSEELNQGTMMRYLSEMIWFPTAFLGENISWEAVDENSARVTFHDCGKSVSALMHFDDQGRLTNFTAQRFREIGGDFSLDPWSTPITGYGMRADLNLPVRGLAVWNLPEGDLTYADLEIEEIAYNSPD
jgi:hypothetical protein